MMGSATFEGWEHMDGGVQLQGKTGSSVGGMDVPTVDRHIKIE